MYLLPRIFVLNNWWILHIFEQEMFLINWFLYKEITRNQFVTFNKIKWKWKEYEMTWLKWNPNKQTHINIQKLSTKFYLCTSEILSIPIKESRYTVKRLSFIASFILSHHPPLFSYKKPIECYPYPLHTRAHAEQNQNRTVFVSFCFVHSHFALFVSCVFVVN